MNIFPRIKGENNKGNSMGDAPGVHERIGKYMLADVFPFVLDLERSQGNHIYDSRDQRYLLDGFSFIASNPLGYNHPGLNDEEFEEKLLRVAKIKPSNSDLYTKEMADFVETFVRIAMPIGAKHLFFVEGGTMAVENALKTAFDWKVRLNQKRGVLGERGTKILHFREAFHGRSGYSLSLTNTDQKKTKFFPKFDWPRVTNPKLSFPLTDESRAITRKLEEQSISEIHSAIKDNPGDIAAIILEPIQGEGGDNHFSVEFHQEIRKICDQAELLMIYDEVQTGIGLTGKMWAQEHYGVVPDITCFGKKTQVCGIAVSDKIENVDNHVFEETSRINSTWGGNLVDMVRAERYLEIIQESQLVKNAETVGAILLEELEALADRHSDIFSNARGKGLMCGLDVVTPEKRAQIIKGTLDNGAIILGSGARTLRLRPSLTFTADNVLELMRAIEKAV